MRNTALSCQANERPPLDWKSRLPSSIRVVLPFIILVKAMIMLAMYSSAAVLHPICTEQAISLSSVLLLAVSFVIMRKYFRRTPPFIPFSPFISCGYSFAACGASSPWTATGPRGPW